MNQYEVYRRVINKILNREMKKKFHYYDYVFFLNPIQYLKNRCDVSVFFVEEIISVNIKTTINEYQKDRLTYDLKSCLNSITPYVEGGDYKKISRVKIKFNQRVCSGIIPKFPNLKQQIHD
jgi:hypothetical protein